MKAKPARQRLDHLLVERGFAESLPKAAAMILAGEVQVDGQRAEKAGTPVTNNSQVTIARRQPKYTSRGGMKLEGALEDFAFDPSGLVCLDIGAAHGGFTDCLLQHRAAHVYAVDVNVEQLDWKLRQDARVIRIERNARELRHSNVPELVDLVVIDVSFISACKVIAPAAELAKSGANFFILVKPQFELPREEIGHGGVVANRELHEKAILAVRQHTESIGLEFLGVSPSHLPGAEGNQEYFVHARKKSIE